LKNQCVLLKCALLGFISKLLELVCSEDLIMIIGKLWVNKQLLTLIMLKIMCDREFKGINKYVCSDKWKY